MVKVIFEISIGKLVREKKLKTLKLLLEEMEPANIAEMIEELPAEEKVVVFGLLSGDLASEVFSELELQQQKELISSLKPETIKTIISNMDPDDRTDFFSDIPGNLVKQLVTYLSPDDRKEALILLNYPEDSAGRLLTPEYLEIPSYMSVKQALEYIEKIGETKETIYKSFVVDRKNRLVGSIDLKDLIFADENEKILNLVKPDPIFVHALDSQEEVAQLMKKYDLIVVPVVDNNNTLLGIITIDDIMDVIEEETTEDIYHMANLTPTDSSYFYTPSWTFIKSRLPWILGLLLLESLSGEIVDKYSQAISTIPILAVFITTIIETGGNVGSQISTLVIRQMAVGEIEMEDLWKVVKKEILIALFIGLLVGTALFIRAFLVSQNMLTNFTAGLALGAVILYSDLVGAILPFLGKFLKVDPAIMAGPLLTTIIDVSGIALYFYIVTRILL
jgi:magnesium transporter